MKRIRTTTATALVAALLAACSPSDATAPVPGLAETDALASLLADAGRGGSGSGSVFDQLAAKIPGFAGLHRTAPCAVVVSLTSEGNAAQAVAVVVEVLTPLMGRGCAGNLDVTAERADNSHAQLQRYLKAAEPLLRIPGVAGVHIDYGQNALVFTVRSREVAAAVLAALPGTGIPAGAVTFQGSASGGGAGSRG